MPRRPEDLGMVVNERAVVQDGNSGLFDEFFIPENGCGKNDIVGLPFAGAFAGVYCGRGLPIDGCGRTIGVYLACIRIEDLKFIPSHEKYAAVSHVVGFVAVWRIRGSPFDVELAIAEGRFGR